MDPHGRVELAEIARLRDIQPAEARAQLGQLVFDDPAEPERLIAAAEFLSGQVREKLAAARAAAAAWPETTASPRTCA